MEDASVGEVLGVCERGVEVVAPCGDALGGGFVGPERGGALEDEVLLLC